MTAKCSTALWWTIVQWGLPFHIRHALKARKYNCFSVLYHCPYFRDSCSNQKNKTFYLCGLNWDVEVKCWWLTWWCGRIPCLVQTPPHNHSLCMWTGNAGEWLWRTRFHWMDMPQLQWEQSLFPQKLGSPHRLGRSMILCCMTLSLLIWKQK